MRANALFFCLQEQKCIFRTLKVKLVVWTAWGWDFEIASSYYPRIWFVVQVPEGNKDKKAQAWYTWDLSQQKTTKMARKL